MVVGVERVPCEHETPSGEELPVASFQATGGTDGLLEEWRWREETWQTILRANNMKPYDIISDTKTHYFNSLLRDILSTVTRKRHIPGVQEENS